MEYLKNKIRLSVDNLKFIAIIIMFIDHAAYGLLHLYMQNHSFDIDPDFYTKLNKTYEYMRNFGRIAFPIFAFFLVEGFYHTKNVYKYALRLGLFAIISEIPFDLGMYQQIIYNKHQNVMLTLFIGLVTMIIFDYIKKIPGYSDALRAVLYICVSIAAMDIGQLTYTDYKWKGVMLVIVLYFVHEYNPFRLIAGSAAICWEKFAPIAFLLIYFYDETKRPSHKLKYVFYCFYPVHLLIIYFIGVALHL